MRRGSGQHPCCRGLTGGASVMEPPAGDQRGVAAVGDGSPGVICRNSTGRGRRSMNGSPAGRRTGPGPACSSGSRSGTTPSGRYGGRCRPTPPSTGSTGTPPAPAKGGGDGGRTGRTGTHGDRPGARPVPRRADRRGHPARDGRGLLTSVVTLGNANDSTVFDRNLTGRAYQHPKHMGGSPREGRTALGRSGR